MLALRNCSGSECICVVLLCATRGQQRYSHTEKTPNLLSYSHECFAEIMNLERVSNEEKLNLCRKYYLGMFLKLMFVLIST